MEDLAIQKIQISGPTLASILHRFSASPGDIHGLLFGRISSSLSDDTAAADDDAHIPILTATITSFFSIPSHFPLLHQSHLHDSPATLLGWFSSRRKTHLRPSLNDCTTAVSLTSSTSPSFALHNSSKSLSLPPSLFLLLTTPFQDQLIHTHEYKAFQYRISTGVFEPKSLDIVNIGPSFRSNYDSFRPNFPFPSLACELRGSNAVVEDENNESLAGIKRGVEDQNELDMCVEGFEVGRFSKLMGSNAAHYTAGVEELYDKMLTKLDCLATLVEKSSAKVSEQENHNMRLRYKVAGLE